MNTTDTAMNSARPVRDRKAQDCTDKADALISTWSGRAYEFLEKFAKDCDHQFLGEEVVSRSRGEVPEPHDKRAWGSVFTKAARRGVIRRVGWSTATKNCSAKPVYVGVSRAALA
jgi:hypothetical protein